jgi:peptidoglycan-associated lipoprotein
MRGFNGLVIKSMGIAGAVLLMGCPPKQVAKPATTSGDLSQTATADAGDTAPITAEELQTLIDNFDRVHFAFDRADLDDSTKQVLAANAEILLKHPDVKVQVEGHADHYGSDIYNLALGQRRAESARRYLLDMGVLPSQLEVISYGEERPIVGDLGKDDEAPNRRAEFLVIVGGGKVESSY